MNVFHRAHTVSSRAQRWNILREFHRLQCHVARPCQELELRGACHPNSWLVPFDAYIKNQQQKWQFLTMPAEQWQTAVGIDVADHQMLPKCSPLQRSSGRATLYRRPTSVTDEGMSRAWLCTGTGLDVLGFHTLYSLSSSCSSARSE